MFTLADIKEIAIQIERNGEAAYREAAEKAADPAVAEIFTWMADEEKRHAEWFEMIESDKALSEEEQELERMGRQLLQEMVADQTFSLDHERLIQLSEFSEMVGQSKSFEQDTILFYEFLKGLIDDEKTSENLEKIIREERRHFEQLEEMEEAEDGLCRNLALT